MSEDLKLLCENLEREKNALGKTFEDWRRGFLNESDFQKLLREAIYFLLDKREIIQREKQKLETRINTGSRNIFKCLSDALICCSEACNTARQASRHNTTEKTNTCYLKVQEAGFLLMQAVVFLEGYREYHEEKTRFIELKKMIGCDRLLKLLTIQTTEFLFRQVDEFWSKSIYQEGKIVLQICRRRLSDLLRKTSEIDQPEELENRLEKIRRLGAQAESFVSGRKEITVFKELTPVRDLVKNGFPVLADRLISDLEHLFTPCRIFFEEYDSYRNFLKEESLPVAVSADEIRRLVAESGWESAACKLSESTLKAYTEKLTGLNFRASANNRKLAEKFKAHAADSGSRDETFSNNYQEEKR